MKLLLPLAELPRSTFYYYLRQLKKPEKYQMVKESIVTIFHENKKRYGYRRITQELHNNGTFCESQDRPKAHEAAGIGLPGRARKSITPTKVNLERSAPKPSGTPVQSRPAQPQVGHRCDRIQGERPEALSVSDSRFVQWRSCQLQFKRHPNFKQIRICWNLHFRNCRTRSTT